MEKYEKDILEKARKLDRFEKDYLKLRYEKEMPEDKQEQLEYINSLFNLGWDAFEIKNEILSEYPYITNLQINDPAVKKILDKIRDDSFLSISFYTNISEAINKKRKKGDSKYSTSVLDYFSDQTNEFFDEFHSRHHYRFYFRNIMTIGPIISASKIPPEARYYFEEIREAYALDLPYSCVALCRAIMEMCLFDKLNKKGFFKKDKNDKVLSFDVEKQDRLYFLIRMAKKIKLLNNEMEELAHRIRLSANEILHPKEKRPSKGKNVHELIINTIKILEHMYR